MEAAGREAKCPYVLLLRRHCPLPTLLRKPPAPPTASQRETEEAEVLTANEPRLSGSSTRTMELDLDLDYQFDSSASDAVPAADPAQCTSSGGDRHGSGSSVLHGGSKTANDPVRERTCRAAVSIYSAPVVFASMISVQESRWHMSCFGQK